MKNMTPAYILGLGIAIYFLAYTVPPALTVLFNVSTETWSPAVVGLWSLIGLAIVAVILFVFLPERQGE